MQATGRAVQQLGTRESLLRESETNAEVKERAESRLRRQTWFKKEEKGELWREENFG